MNQRYIIFVPGKNPKPPAAQHKELLWKCLAEGLRRVSYKVSKNTNLNKDNFKLISWNYIYSQIYKDVKSADPWINTMIAQSGPSEQDKKEAHNWHLRFDRLLYSAVDFFPKIMPLLPGAIKATIQETERYFQNKQNIACTIRELLKKELRSMLCNHDKILLIGHSMGSIIAYDALWELSHLESLSGKVDFLTIGSPLGMNFVQHRLNGHQYKAKKRFPSKILIIGLIFQPRVMSPLWIILLLMILVKC